MRLTIKSILKQEKGMAMVAVLGMLVVIMILTTSMLIYYRQDVRETTQLESRIQAYYLALSGIELAYAALIIPNDPLIPTGPKFMDDFINHPAKAPETHTQALTGGQAVITISNVTIDSKRWVQVRSVGTLTSGVSVTTDLRIDWANPVNVVRVQPNL